MMTLTFHDKKESFTIQTNKQEGEWSGNVIESYCFKHEAAHENA
jgi:hypothetical protein